MSCHFISVQGTYNKIEIALFRDSSCIEVISKSDVKASSHLIPLLDMLLQKHNINLKDLAFVAVDKGPGAFTSLRVTIATVNGLAAASNVPLIGISGLDALAYQVSALVPQDPDKLSMIVCLLNAYNNEVYYLLASGKETSVMGCKKIEDLLGELVVKARDYHHIQFVGNAVELHRDLIHQAYSDIAVFDPVISFCSAESVGLLAYRQWQTNQKTVDQIIPLYLKTQVFAVRK